MKSVWEIPVTYDGNIVLRYKLQDDQLPDTSDRLQMVERKVASRKEKPNSSALDNYRTKVG